MTGMFVLFWFSLFMTVYAYLGYPALLWLLARCANRPTSRGNLSHENKLPPVTLLVSAYNEETVMGEKIHNALSLDYPRELLEVVVVSDGSNDGTTSVVSSFADKGVVLRHYEGRIGKTACLNRAVPLATGEIIVFSDANSTYDRSALNALVHPFEDSRVGFVTGWTQYGSSRDKSALNSLGLYSRLELITKELESRIGSCVGADGAIFAIRKALYQPLKDYDINDFVIPLTINAQGYRGVLEKKAICYENDAGGTKGEFFRQVRITNRTLRALNNHRQLLNPLKFGFLAFAIFSHKLCKFVVPYFLMVLLVTNFFLIKEKNFYLMVLMGQILFYTGASISSLLPKSGFLTRFSEAAKAFVMVNAAILLAWAKFFQGETYTTWSPTQR
jgi:cellulose synthase/poly-beta-1,6-N-acetylglucosamine synthase-like glycosyltransferase